MKPRATVKFLVLALALMLPTLFLASRLVQPTGVARGKSPAAPLSEEMSPEQQLAQDLALSDPRVQGYTVGRRSEVFGVRLVGDHFPASSQVCAQADCRQVEIYNFDENAAVTAIVNLDSRQVLDVLYQPGVHPGINGRLAERARQIAFNDPQVIAALGFRPTAADMAPVDAGHTGTACDQGHLCVAPTFELGDRVLWAIVDLTDERLAAIDYTDMQPARPGEAVRFEGQGCTTPGVVSRDGWLLSYEVTGTDGMRVYNVTYNGVPVLTSVKLLEWHADYGATGFEDYTGCGGGGGGFPIYPYGQTQVLDLFDEGQNVVGFEVVQDFRMGSWGNYCNYRYEQHIQFFTDGRFRVVSGAFGKGCGTNATYRPVVRIDVAVAGDENDNFALWDGVAWQSQAVEGWWSQGEPYTAEGTKWRITDQSGAGYDLQPGQDDTFGDGGRGDNAFIYVTQHKPEEGDTDLGTIGYCCYDDYRQGPHNYLNGENIADENIVVWYVPQMATDANAGSYYCWTVSGEPNPETYPCFSGPMFHPISGAPPAIELNATSLEVTQASNLTSTLELEIGNVGGTPLDWTIQEFDNAASPNPLALNLAQVATGLNEPLDIDAMGDNRLFITEKDGTIQILNGGLLAGAPFLDISARVGSAGSEQGLLGLAFHPDYADNGQFFVNYTNNSGDTVVSRFYVTADPNVADPNSEEVLLTIDQPYSNHNGGNLAFGPDGYLYIGMGDGGSGGDPGNRAQNGLQLLGKMLRIDVDQGAPYTIPPDNPFVGDPNTLDEIWALGVRNPWRFSFDTMTGDLLVGDVGQDAWEEVDFQPADSGGGENYGWRCYEGTHAYNTSGCDSYEAYDPPIYEYSHSGGNCTVIGGYVYRGMQYPALFGRYLLNDYCSGNFWDLQPDGNGGWLATAYPGLGGFGFVAFGLGSDGELYAANLNGSVYHVQENSGGADIPWLSLSSYAGTTPPGSNSAVQVTFDSTGLADGSYTGSLRVFSNDPGNPVLELPVTLNVSSGIPMHVDRLRLQGQVQGPQRRVRASLLLLDEGGAPVGGAAVHITWTLPDNSTVAQTAVTNAGGNARFQFGSTQAGTYTITVTDVVKNGYLFDAEGSVLTKSVTLP